MQKGKLASELEPHVRDAKRSPKAFCVPPKTGLKATKDEHPAHALAGLVRVAVGRGR